MRFVFRFQKILDFKLGEEEKAQKVLAECVGLYNQCLADLEKIQASQKSYQANFLQGQGISIADTFLTISHLSEELRKRLEELQSSLEEKRELYLQAKREKETFELLKKRDQKKYQYLQKKREQHILDEYGRNMYILSQIEGEVR